MSDFITRYSFGGDEFVFVELSEDFSLETIFRIIAITRKIKEKNLQGIYDVCPANASYMLRFDPDQIHPRDLVDELKAIEKSVTNLNDIEIQSRLVEVPVFFEDPWTYDTVMKFRDRHQDPTASDIEYCARINGYESTQSFIDAITGTPFLTINVGFVPGLPWCYQLVEQAKQIEVPKYVRPRTYTPERSFAFAGAFAVIYPTEGTGGAQLFGINPAPVFDKEQKLPDFKESMVFPRPGDIFNFRSITREEFDSIRDEVEKGTFEYYKKDFAFTPKDTKDLNAFSYSVKRRLYHD